jgi:methyl-accepting chemotaxis protein
MKNLKISAKLIVGFSVVVLLTLAMGVTSILFANRIDHNYSELINFDTASLNDLMRARASMYNERSELRAMMIYILRDDAEGLQKAAERYRAAADATKKSMDAYRPTLRTDKGRELIEEFDKQYADYTATAETFMTSMNSADDEQLLALLTNGAGKMDQATESINGMADAKYRNTMENNNELTERSVTGIRIVAGILVVVVLLSIGLAVRIAALITKPLALMRRLLVQVGETGDLAFGEDQMRAIKAEAAYKDEIAQSIAAFVRMMEQFSYYGECLGAVAERDLTVKVRTLSDRDTCGVALKHMLHNLNAIFGEISLSASQVAAGSSQIAQASTNLATGASEQAATLEEFTATVSEVHRMADENTKMATEALSDVQASGRMMGECTNEMDKMLHAMQEINEKSQHISNVIKVIDDIAFQTNILALNAAVEAARAGQHGKGFAVVSDEVRNLASKSAGAAKETAELIESSLRSVSEGNAIVDKVNDSLRAVGDIANKNAASMDKLYNGSTQQSSSMAEINTAITQLSSVVQANSATAEETAASSEEMSAQSVTLNDIVSRFKVDRNDGASWTAPASESAAPNKGRPEDLISLFDENDKY